ncbi:MAG: tRNA pseudouridine(38-40) synthase TruA [Hespellia sp.]|nr:tRNA pseudouridine(38-40) synthase TruA [Hespellia sp.]
MRTYKLTIAYDGSRFRGWQRQPDTDLTIQGTLERIVSELAGYPVEVQGSGRTDGGVHASAQVASIILSGKIEEEAYKKEINRKLPEDIRVLDIALMKNGFHARKKAHGKHYVYTVDTREKADVFTRKYAYHFPEKIDVVRMGEAAERLIGKHDFAAFTDRMEPGKSTVREIYQISIDASDDKIRIDYNGSGFMYHMVRILTGTLLETGTGARKPEQITEALETKVRQMAGPLAPSQGLCLTEVDYEA